MDIVLGSLRATLCKWGQTLIQAENRIWQLMAEIQKQQKASGEV
jgi:hypothetical protein